MSKLTRRFADLKIKQKLSSLGIIFIICLIFTAIATHFLLNSIEGLIMIIDEEKIIYDHFEQCTNEFYKYQITGDDENLQESLKNIDEAIKMSFTIARIDSFMNVMSREDWAPYFLNVFDEGLDNNLESAEFLGDQINFLLKTNKKELSKTQELAYENYTLGKKIKSSIQSYSKEKTEEKSIFIQTGFSQLYEISRNINSNLYTINKKLSDTLDIGLIILVVLFGAISYIITTRISRTISVPVNQLTDNFKQIAKGKLKSSETIDSKNEIGELSSAFSTILLNLQNIISYSKKVAKGNYGIKLTPNSKNDELSFALNEMAEKLNESRIKDDKESWLQKGITDLDDQMRGDLTIRELSEKIIIFLSQFLEAEIGAIYIFDENNGYFELTGSIGLNTDKIKKHVKPGEGLVGKTALHNSLQILNTKNRYYKIYSATGEIIPEKLYLLPLFFNNKIQAVVELSSINQFSELKIEYLNLIAHRIPLNIGAAITKYRNKELLEKTLEQSKELQKQQDELTLINSELQAQQEELRVANEELAEQTKILTENEKNLQMQQEELRVINEELEERTTELERQKKDISEKNETLNTARKELEEKAKELEMANQYKSEFLANMSHELRTPLNSLLILSKLLGKNKNGNLNDEQIKSLNIIHKSGNDLLELINEILDLSKIEAGKIIYEFAEVTTDDIVSEIKQGFSAVAEDKGLKLEINRSENFPDTIVTDRQRLLQIIKNLLSNAFKFTSSGSIKVNLAKPEAGSSFANPKLNSGNTFYISVEDSGVGIPQNKMAEIFEAFQQADGSISRKYGGTGLGLSISKELSYALGGEIHVDSTEGIGSIFTVFLPLNHKETTREISSKEKIQPVSDSTEKIQKKTETEVRNPEMKREMPFFINDDRESELQRLTVLIIHNEKEKAKKIIDLCHKRKLNVIVAASIDDGITLTREYSPQAIILSAELNDDAEMQNLMKNESTNQLPVHVVSRIEDLSFDDFEELKTPTSSDFQGEGKNIESKLRKNYKQVLVVEDDEATRNAIHLLFENKDLIIHEAKTGQQAYNMISTKPFDCIILDLGLPDFSGNELLDKLKSDNIPIPNVIIHTGRELETKELHDLQKYSDSIIIKGVKSDERLMDEVTLFLHQVENSVPKTYAAIPEDPDSPPCKGKKVLVVDDDIRNVFAVAQILEDREIKVFEAENGQMALEVLKNNPDIDLVLMDIMMPVMDGYEAMKIIRKTPKISNIPIITLTAKAMKEDYQKAIDSGANDYISKPINVDKLMTLLKIWLLK